MEFALVAPVALLMILGSIEFGRAMFVHMLAVNAARTACRQASLATATNESVTTGAEELLGGLGIKGATVVILVDGEQGADLAQVRGEVAERRARVWGGGHHRLLPRRQRAPRQ